MDPINWSQSVKKDVADIKNVQAFYVQLQFITVTANTLPIGTQKVP